MRLIVSGIPEDGIERELRIPLILDEIILKEDVQVFLKIFRHGNKVTIDGFTKSTASLVCSRCLKEILYPLKIDTFGGKQTLPFRVGIIQVLLSINPEQTPTFKSGTVEWVDFCVEYLPQKEAIQHREHELIGNDLNVSFYEDDEIDMKGLIREKILLAVPMKPLCKTECSGICPQCGKNLNTASCKCITKKIDPRLAKLETLKESIKKGN